MSGILTSEWSLSLGGLAALAAATFILFVVYARAQNATTKRKVSKSTRTVVLTGPMAGGKTSLFSKLMYGHAPPTHTSMKENEGLVKQKWPAIQAKEALLEKEADKEVAEPTPLAKPIEVIDTPGHARLRARALAQFLPAADGIIFVVDGAHGLTGQRVREAGEHLHLLLSLLPLLPTAPPLLILLSKSDTLPASAASAASSKIVDRAKLALARELDRRRLAARSASASAGARLEGLEAPLASTAGSLSLTGLWEALIGANQVAERPAVSLPSDEAEILSGEAFAFEGAFEWQKLAETGVEVDWAVASVKAGDGLEGLYGWVDNL